MITMTKAMCMTNIMLTMFRVMHVTTEIAPTTILGRIAKMKKILRIFIIIAIRPRIVMGAISLVTCMTCNIFNMVISR